MLREEGSAEWRERAAELRRATLTLLDEPLTAVDRLLVQIVANHPAHLPPASPSLIRFSQRSPPKLVPAGTADGADTVADQAAGAQDQIMG